MTAFSNEMASRPPLNILSIGGLLMKESERLSTAIFRFDSFVVWNYVSDEYYPRTLHDTTELRGIIVQEYTPI
jgi:hypothetical protein